MKELEGLPEKNILSFGGGRQSTSLALQIYNEALPRVDAIIFADTGAERNGTLKNVARMKELLAEKDIPLVVVNDGNIMQKVLNFEVSLPVFTNSSRWEDVEGLKELFLADVKRDFYKQRRKAKEAPTLFSETRTLDEVLVDAEKEFEDRKAAGLVFAHYKEMDTGQLNRACTERMKITPVRKWYLENLNPTEDDPVGVWIGFAIEELSRMKSAKDGSDNKTIYPLIQQRMSTHDCLEYIKLNDYPVPVSSSCTFCPYRSNPSWSELSEAEFKAVANFEDAFNRVIREGKYADKPYFANGVHFHRSKRPIRERPFEKDTATDPENEMKCSDAGCWT